MTDQRKRYSDEDLAEFKQIIDEKLKVARASYKDMMDQLSKSGSNSTDDTAVQLNIIEEGTEQQEQDRIITMAQRQQKFIKGLEAALVRIENKTYGVDRITGELIPKERLRAVPIATLSVESKNSRRNH